MGKRKNPQKISLNQEAGLLVDYSLLVGLLIVAVIVSVTILGQTTKRSMERSFCKLNGGTLSTYENGPVPNCNAQVRPPT